MRTILALSLAAFALAVPVAQPRGLGVRVPSASKDASVNSAANVAVNAANPGVNNANNANNDILGINVYSN
ncbi:hypothetical protein EDB85DRAFT_2155600 [Lactarius pseudohatsudake]|nr:hypothetical protein EDB85DRAFT_2155600 [Lactarius pseudohatsudake]